MTGAVVALSEGSSEQTRTAADGVAVVGRSQIHQARLRRGAETAQDGQSSRAAVANVAQSTIAAVMMLLLLLIQ